MTRTWTDWEGFEDNPNWNWHARQHSGNSILESGGGGAKLVRFSSLPESLLRDPKNESASEDNSEQEDDEDPNMELLDEVFSATLARVPEYALSGVQAANGELTPSFIDEPDLEQLPEIGLDSIIVGVIDLGIPLGHNRFRDEHGKTRILAAWQQLAEWRGNEAVPFGHELYKDGIDALIAEHSGGNPKGWLDEDAFNRATGVVDMKNVQGSREAAGRESHGAHVMDLAAGHDPDPDPDPQPKSGYDVEFRDKVKMIAVNVPDSRIFGTAGEFLEGFLFAGVQRILTIADAIWKKSNTEGSEQNGFPVVINLSWGKQAGSKTRMDPFAKMLDAIRKKRAADKKSPVEFVLPVGNDNLSRSNAFLEPAPGESMSLNWRIPPDDQSSNYAEVWVHAPREHENMLNGRPGPLVDVTLQPPTQGISPSTPDDTDLSGNGGKLVRRWAQVDGQPELAAIYRETIDLSEEAGSADRGSLIRYVLCVAPTTYIDGRQEAPAGMWRIHVRNHTDQQMHCVLSVQSDQQLLPGSTINRRSYFDDPLYRKYEDSGHPVESYTYPIDPATPDRARNRDLESSAGGSDRPSPVRRHGTMSATSVGGSHAAVGGYRSSDGRPAIYSSTGRGRQPKDGVPSDDDGTLARVLNKDNRRAPTASFATDDGPLHQGILAAGASNGSVVAMRGTSFAAAQATRLVAQTFLWEAPEFSDRSASKRIFDQAANGIDKDSSVEGRWKTRKGWAGPNSISVTEVLGGGRVERQGETRVNRTDRLID